MQTQIGKVMETNQYTGEVWLNAQSDEEARLIVAERTPRERKSGGVWRKHSAPADLRISDSDYIDQGNYVQTMIRLQDIFICLKMR